MSTTLVQRLSPRAGAHCPENFWSIFYLIFSCFMKFWTTFGKSNFRFFKEKFFYSLKRWLSMRRTTFPKSKMNYFESFGQQRTWAPLAQGASSPRPAGQFSKMRMAIKDPVVWHMNSSLERRIGCAKTWKAARARNAPCALSKLSCMLARSAI